MKRFLIRGAAGIIAEAGLVLLAGHPDVMWGVILFTLGVGLLMTPIDGK